METTPDYKDQKRDPRNPPDPGEAKTERQVAGKEGKEREGPASG